MNAFSNPDLGIMAIIGNEIVVKLKLPLIIFLPISLIIVLPTLLDKLTIFLSKQAVPPDLLAVETLYSSFYFIH